MILRNKICKIHVWTLVSCLLFPAEAMKVKKTDLPVIPSEDILPSLDDEADESDMDDGK